MEIREPKKRDKSRKHNLILNAATEVFTKKGFDAASMDEIAEFAGISKRTIYNHFQSKERLFQEMVARFLSKREAIKPLEYERDRSLESQLRDFAKAELFLIDDPIRRSLSRLLTSVFLMNPEFGKATRGQYAPHRGFIRWITDAQADGKLREGDPALAARIFYGLVEGCLTWGALMSDGESLAGSEPLLSEIITVFLARYGTDSRETH